jgi:hypothetical protein
LKKIFAKQRKPNKKIKVVALVGGTGTGKSFRARLITEKMNIDLLIDDGLLIKGDRILAGKSAKREKNKVTAIKRAIFEDVEHAEEICRTLAQEKYRSILILGTSEKMIARIVERLTLPYPDEVIYIEDIASREEISLAKDTRKSKGKHVIPVPVIEVKQDPSHRILDSIKLFLKRHPVLPWRKEMIEKTVVQPPFSRRGALRISEAALGQMILHCVQQQLPNVVITRIRIDLALNGYELEVKLAVPPDMILPDTLSNLQEYIISNIERFSGIHIEELDLTVDQIVKP